MYLVYAYIYICLYIYIYIYNQLVPQHVCASAKTSRFPRCRFAGFASLGHAYSVTCHRAGFVYICIRGGSSKMALFCHRAGFASLGHGSRSLHLHCALTCYMFCICLVTSGCHRCLTLSASSFPCCRLSQHVVSNLPGTNAP